MKRECYKEIGYRKLSIDIFETDQPKHTHTGIIMLHGGAWKVGDPSMMHVYAKELSVRGFVVFAAEYRLIGEAAWPAQLEDVKSAVRWVRSHADRWDIYPDKIAVQGFSAGGHLALMAGATPNDPSYKSPDNSETSDAANAIVSFFAPVAFTSGPEAMGVRSAEVLLEKNATEEQARSISPLYLANADFPPTFLLHGTSDTTVPHKTSLSMAAALEEYGVTIELHLYPGQHHEFARLPSIRPLVLLEVSNFLHRTLVNPQAYVQESQSLNPFDNTGPSS